MPSTVIVIPCFNERERLDQDSVAALLASPAVRLVFVDDGSCDGTDDLLQAVAEAHPGRVEVMTQPSNQGKAEAVRTGLVHALESGAGQVGYLDADFSTPAAEMLRLIGCLNESDASMVLGSRVRLLGRDVERRMVRHYLGRVFATAASLTVGLAVYDTQCGAKVMRRSTALEEALSRPFISRWVFDVELIDRLLRPASGTGALTAADFLEVPLARWHDVKGSKLSPKGMARAGVDLLRMVASRRR